MEIDRFNLDREPESPPDWDIDTPERLVNDLVNLIATINYYERTMGRVNRHPGSALLRLRDHLRAAFNSYTHDKHR